MGIVSVRYTGAALCKPNDLLNTSFLVFWKWQGGKRRKICNVKRKKEKTTRKTNKKWRENEMDRGAKETLKR